MRRLETHSVSISADHARPRLVDAINPNGWTSSIRIGGRHHAARALRELTDFERAFAGMTANKPDAIVIVTDGLTIQNRRPVFEIAATNQLPALYEELDFSRP